MSVANVPASTDLLIPKPAAGETWASHTIHAHYFGFTLPQANIGVFIYVRYRPCSISARAASASFRAWTICTRWIANTATLLSPCRIPKWSAISATCGDV